MIKAVLVHISIFLIVYLLLFRKQSKAAYLINIFLSVWFMYIVYTFIPWSTYGSAYLKYVYLLLYTASLLTSLKYSKSIDNKQLTLWYKIGKYSLKGTLIFFMIVISIIDIESRMNSKSRIVRLDFPLKNGDYYITSGGNNILLNYHQGLAEPYYHLAYDISKIGTFGTTKSSNLFSNAKKNEDVFIFSDSIFSPCDGLVTSVINTEVDHEPGNLLDFNELQANIVEIKTGNKFIVLAHFKQNSIAVDTNTKIKKGQFLGLVGNSGESSSPHLHIHARDNDYQPIEIKFNNTRYKKNDIIKVKKQL